MIGSSQLPPSVAMNSRMAFFQKGGLLALRSAFRSAARGIGATRPQHCWLVPRIRREGGSLCWTLVCPATDNTSIKLSKFAHSLHVLTREGCNPSMIIKSFISSPLTPGKFKLWSAKQNLNRQHVLPFFHLKQFTCGSHCTGGHRTRVAAVTLDKMAERVFAQREHLP